MKFSHITPKAEVSRGCRGHVKLHWAQTSYKYRRCSDKFKDYKIYSWTQKEKSLDIITKLRINNGHIILTLGSMNMCLPRTVVSRHLRHRRKFYVSLAISGLLVDTLIDISVNGRYIPVNAANTNWLVLAIFKYKHQ